MPISVSAYFPPLVNYFRTHITKLLLAGLIWAGIGLYLVRPVQAETNSKAFTNWLETVVKKGENGNIQQQIYRLKESKNSLNSLIQKASEIISKHNDEFDLPLGERSSDSDQIYNMLVLEWSYFQTGNGMGKASVPQKVKPGIQPNVDKFAHNFDGRFNNGGYRICYVLAEPVPFNYLPVSYAIVPLSGGIAIGAP